MVVKLEWLGYRMVKKCDEMLSRFYLIPERNGQTDTDRFATSISRVSMLTRDKNEWKLTASGEFTQDLTGAPPLHPAGGLPFPDL